MQLREEDKKEHRDIDSLVVHHTGSRILRGFDSPRLVKLRHKLIRGWADIGYHFLIGNGKLTEDGLIYEGRPIEEAGAHAFGNNAKSVGIALIGNFEYSKPSGKQLYSLNDLLVRLCNAYNLGADAIKGHRELTGANTSCPGRYVDMGSVRQSVSSSLQSTFA